MFWAWLIWGIQWIVGIVVMVAGWLDLNLGSNGLQVKHLLAMMLISCGVGWVFVIVGIIWAVGSGKLTLKILNTVLIKRKSSGEETQD